MFQVIWFHSLLTITWISLCSGTSVGGLVEAQTKSSWVQTPPWSFSFSWIILLDLKLHDYSHPSPNSFLADTTTNDKPSSSAEEHEKKLAENAIEHMKQEESSKLHLKEVEQVTGEEGERNVIQVSNLISEIRTQLPHNTVFHVITRFVCLCRCWVSFHFLLHAFS